MTTTTTTLHRSNVWPRTVEYEASHQFTQDDTFKIYKRTPWYA